MLPFTLEIHDSEGNVLAVISRGWTFFMSKINIHDAQGAHVGSIKQKFAFLKPTFKIFDPSETLLAEITGDWKAWDFKINDSSNNLIGTVNKKWAGVLKEVFTSADKYIVSVNPDLKELGHRMAILSGAITIDMVLKESK